MNRWIPIGGLAAMVALIGPPALADCLAEVNALEQKLASGGNGSTSNGSRSREGDDTAAGAGGQPTDAPSEGQGGGEKADALTDEGMKVEEAGGTTTYAEGGPAQPAENWFGDARGELGKAVEERLVAAKTFAEEGDEQACRRELEKAQALVDG